jgi:acyl-CoA hydrolase
MLVQNQPLTVESAQLSEDRVINPVEITTMRLVKSEDLNHHRTLYAGRSAEWFVETGFLVISQLVNQHNAVCLKIHEMQFLKPVKPGQTIQFKGKLIKTGKSSFTVHISAKTTGLGVSADILSGFITFVHVDDNGKSTPHHYQVVPVTNDDKLLYEKATHLQR